MASVNIKVTKQGLVKIKTKIVSVKLMILNFIVVDARRRYNTKCNQVFIRLIKQFVLMVLG